MQYHLIFYPKVKEELRKLAPETKRLIRAALDELSTNPNAGFPLSDELAGLWKYRAKRYRIIYRVEVSTREVIIYIVGERENVYYRLREIMKEQGS